MHIRISGVEVEPDFHDRTRALLGRRLARFGTHIEHASVRIKDINGPRGGVDTLCRVKLTVSGRPPVLVEERALDAERALRRAAASVPRAMERSVERTGSRKRRAPAPTRPAVTRAHTKAAAHTHATDLTPAVRKKAGSAARRTPATRKGAT